MGCPEGTNLLKPQRTDGDLIMSKTRYLAAVLLAPLAFGLSACSRDTASAAANESGQPPLADVAAQTLVVHESPHCGCCGLWRDHMEAAGFSVEVRKTHELGTIKATAGVPRRLASCHTARIGGYFVEGHVPAEELQRLLTERPVARGLAVAGMPAGAPGMEMPDGSVQPYEVLLVKIDGSTEVFARYPKQEASCCSIKFDEDDVT
jgi:hypothetical protein